MQQLKLQHTLSPSHGPRYHNTHSVATRATWQPINGLVGICRRPELWANATRGHRLEGSGRLPFFVPIERRCLCLLHYVILAITDSTLGSDYVVGTAFVGLYSQASLAPLDLVGQRTSEAFKSQEESPVDTVDGQHERAGHTVVLNACDKHSAIV